MARNRERVPEPVEGESGPAAIGDAGDVERAPEVAKLAAVAALGDTLPLPGMEPPAVPGEGQAPAPAAGVEPRQRRKRDRSREAGRRRPGRRSREELESENRELRRRAGVPDLAPAAPTPAAPVVDPTEAIALVRELAVAVFGMVAIDRGPHWNLSEHQAERLSLHFGRAIAPHIGQWGDAVPWAFGGMALLQVVRVRVVEDKRLRSGGAPKPAPEPAPAPAPVPPPAGLHQAAGVVVLTDDKP